jgi:DNA ligase D-like protein (predicted 3'-phosphoesterase)
VFVIQQHAARRLHYDVHLEVEGVLKLWSVPERPSTDPRDRRRAIPTDDYPLDYAGFGGVIFKGIRNRGVIVWNTGTYCNLSTTQEGRHLPVTDAIDRGRLSPWLNGKKLRRLHVRPSRCGAVTSGCVSKRVLGLSDGGRWRADIPTESVRSDRTAEEVLEGEP